MCSFPCADYKAPAPGDLWSATLSHSRHCCPPGCYYFLGMAGGCQGLFSQTLCTFPSFFLGKVAEGSSGAHQGSPWCQNVAPGRVRCTVPLGVSRCEVGALQEQVSPGHDARWGDTGTAGLQRDEQLLSAGNCGKGE